MGKPQGRWVWEYRWPWQLRHWRYWLYQSWPEMPIIDGYRRAGAGWRGWRFLGLSKHWEDTARQVEGESNG